MMPSQRAPTEAIRNVTSGGTLHMQWRGRVPYAEAVHMQEVLRDEVLRGDAPGTLLLLEHQPVVTAGRHAGSEDLIAPALGPYGVAFERSDRGGMLTYHGPGQLVAYPIVSLRHLGLGVRDYVAALGRGTIEWLAAQGLQSHWRADAPGVWTSSADHERKIASIGVHVHRQITTHGVAVNLCTDLSHFGLLRPCGFSADVMTTLKRETGRIISCLDAAPGFGASLASALGCGWSALTPLEPKSVR